MNVNSTPGWLLGLLALTAGCANTLTVLHQDPSVGPVDVQVDQDNVGTIEFGEELSVSLDPGFHLVQAYPRGTSTNPWVEEGDSWYFYFDQEAKLTLLGYPPLP